MATIRKEIPVQASAADAWDAIRDIGALHTRLVPGFVVATTLEPGARVVTFGNGMVIREPIVTIDDDAMRLVWSAEGAQTTHYNASAQVLRGPDGSTTVVWTADFLPDSVKGAIDGMMTAGSNVIKQTLDKLASR
jgi:carbon monoxide dehydrogenase subunit G